MNLFSSIINEIIETFKFRFVVFNFVQSTLKLRYQKTLLGFFWSILGPMLHYLVVGIVFSYTMRNGIANYAAYMFTGALYFNVISGVTSRSPIIFISNEHFIKKIYIPKMVFILDTVLVEIVNFLLGFLALLCLGLALNKVNLSIHYSIIPLAILLVIMLTTGIASIISVAGVYFRDLTHIIPVLLQATFFLTPILYQIEVMPPKFQLLIRLNPLTYFIEIFRLPIVFNQWPQFDYILICSIISLLVFTFGLIVMKKFENRIVFRL